MRNEKIVMSHRKKAAAKKTHRTDSQRPTAANKRATTDDDSDEPEDKRQKTGQASGVVEAGKIFFLYRPRVGLDEAHSLSDVQRFYLILDPEGDGKKRLIVIGKKKIPAPKERYFGFVEAVSGSIQDLTDGLGATDNQTKTRGVRHTEPTRIAAEGEYSIAEKDDSRTFLVWKLEVPQEPGDVQQDLSIGKEGSLAISIKNPKKANPGRNVGLSTKADFGEKQKLFDGIPGGYAWISAQDPSLLDFQNAELLLIGAGDDIKGSVGEEVKEELEDKAEDAAERAAETGADEDEEEAKLVEEMKKELVGDAASEKLEEAPAEKQEWK